MEIYPPHYDPSNPTPTRVSLALHAVRPSSDEDVRSRVASPASLGRTSVRTSRHRLFTFIARVVVSSSTRPKRVVVVVDSTETNAPSPFRSVPFRSVEISARTRSRGRGRSRTRASSATRVSTRSRARCDEGFFNLRFNPLASSFARRRRRRARRAPRDRAVVPSRLESAFA